MRVFSGKTMLKGIGLLPFVRFAIIGALGGYQYPQLVIRHTYRITSFRSVLWVVSNGKQPAKLESR